MFAVGDKNNIIAAMRQAFDLLSVPAVLTHVATGATVNLNAGIKTAGVKDEAIVNAYGAGAKVITFKVADVTGFKPAKFDTLTIGTELLVLADVHIHRVNDVDLFFKAYVRGHTS